MIKKYLVQKFDPTTISVKRNFFQEIFYSKKIVKKNLVNKLVKKCFKKILVQKNLVQKNIYLTNGKHPEVICNNVKCQKEKREIWLASQNAITKKVYYTYFGFNAYLLQALTL